MDIGALAAALWKGKGKGKGKKGSANATFAGGASAPMDIGALAAALWKGKGKGKGKKGKGKGKGKGRKGKGKGKGKDFSKSQGKGSGNQHWSFMMKGKGKGKSKGATSTTVCRSCGKTGHFASNCPTYRVSTVEGEEQLWKDDQGDWNHFGETGLNALSDRAESPWWRLFHLPDCTSR
eukprot:s46_g7.t1